MAFLLPSLRRAAIVAALLLPAFVTPAFADCSGAGNLGPAGTTLGQGWSLAPCPSTSLPSAAGAVGSIGSRAGSLAGAAQGLGAAATLLQGLSALSSLQGGSSGGSYGGSSSGASSDPSSLNALTPVPSSNDFKPIEIDLASLTVPGGDALPLSPNAGDQQMAQRCQQLQDAGSIDAISCWGGLAASTHNPQTADMAKARASALNANQGWAQVPQSTACPYGNLDSATGLAGANCLTNRLSPAQCRAAGGVMSGGVNCSYPTNPVDSSTYVAGVQTGLQPQLVLRDMLVEYAESAEHCETEQSKSRACKRATPFTQSRLQRMLATLDAAGRAGLQQAVDDGMRQIDQAVAQGKNSDDVASQAAANYLLTAPPQVRYDDYGKIVGMAPPIGSQAAPGNTAGNTPGNTPGGLSAGMSWGAAAPQAAQGAPQSSPPPGTAAGPAQIAAAKDPTADNSAPNRPIGGVCDFGGCLGLGELARADVRSFTEHARASSVLINSDASEEEYSEHLKEIKELLKQKKSVRIVLRFSDNTKQSVNLKRIANDLPGLIKPPEPEWRLSDEYWLHIDPL